LGGFTYLRLFSAVFSFFFLSRTSFPSFASSPPQQPAAGSGGEGEEGAKIVVRGSCSCRALLKLSSSSSFDEEVEDERIIIII